MSVADFELMKIMEQADFETVQPFKKKREVKMARKLSDEKLKPETKGAVVSFLPRLPSINLTYFLLEYFTPIEMLA